jgi:hypothetical protein
MTWARMWTKLTLVIEGDPLVFSGPFDFETDLAVVAINASRNAIEASKVLGEIHVRDAPKLARSLL